jgi:hypothetical protein
MSKGSEVDEKIKVSKVEEGVRKMESDLIHLKTQRLQLEGALKGRDREIDHLGKLVEGLKGELHEAHAKASQASDTVKRLEVEAAQSRSR